MATLETQEILQQSQRIPVHIPDGFLDTKTIAATTAMSILGIGTAWRRTKATMPQKRVPMLGVAAAFVFAAQMLNFPVAGGTSGHLIGAVLVSVLLGPGASIIVITSVLIVQCFLFADGGVLSLGANIFNMAVVGTVAGYGIYVLVNRIFRGEKGRVVAVAFASLCSVLLASVCCAGELAWSGTVAWGAVFPAMASIHTLIGLGEGLITSLVFAAINNTRPDLLRTGETPSQRKFSGEFIIYGIIITTGLVLFVSPFASTWPDGLESVAARLGFSQKALRNPVTPSLITGYRLPGVGSSAAAQILGGALGVLVILGLAILVMKLRSPRTQARKKTESH